MLCTFVTDEPINRTLVCRLNQLQKLSTELKMEAFTTAVVACEVMRKYCYFFYINGKSHVQKRSAPCYCNFVLN